MLSKNDKLKNKDFAYRTPQDKGEGEEENEKSEKSTD